EAGVAAAVLDDFVSGHDVCRPCSDLCSAQLGNVDFALERGGCRAGHVNGVRARNAATCTRDQPAPLDGQHAAARFHVHAFGEQAEPDACDDRRTCARSTGQRLAGAALPDAPADAAAVTDLHVAGLDALRKALVMLDA